MNYPSTAIYPREEGGQILIRGIPKDTRTAFKVWCAQKETSMTDVVIQLMAAIVNGKIHLNEESGDK